MKKIYTILVCLLFSVNVFTQDKTSEWNKMWEEIKKSLHDGSFDPNKYGLSGLLDLGGSNNMGDFLGQGGLQSLENGGVFGPGGMFDITAGGFLQGLFGNSFGFDELHNDASLNSNVTWGIAHSKFVIHRKINERQEKIISLQDSINDKVKRLYELEKLTVDYLSTKQSDAVDIESYNDLVDITEDCGYYFSESKKLISKAGNLKYIEDRMTVIVITRTARIVTKLLTFARVDGNINLLNNEDRDEIVTYLIDNLREMRGTLAYTYRALLSGSNSDIYSDIPSLQNKIDNIYKK
jgi:hypothetical protein